jgi:hypothetical protein
VDPSDKQALIHIRVDTTLERGKLMERIPFPRSVVRDIRAIRSLRVSRRRWQHPTKNRSLRKPRAVDSRLLST